MVKLATYNQKRDFKKTAEPSGKVVRSKSGHSFLIQKHAASRLHYDFRLELDGVLKSWAVTRGPSLDPQDRRLAVEVEDHPVAYGAFEGMIPQGQYGGGTVMLWDEGTWEPLGDPRKDLKKGSMHFLLHGKRLQGEWVLVRMKDRAQDRGRHNWLLIKHDDAHAKTGQGEKFLAKNATSVTTGRTMEAIAGDADRTWQSKSNSAKKTVAAKAPAKKARKSLGKKLPAFIEPQLATLTDAVPQGKEWLHEVKFDGYRVLAFIEGGRARMMTRNGLDWTAKFGSLPAMLAQLPVENAVLDGELVALNAKNVSSFAQLKGALSGNSDELSYYAFDVLHLNGEDVRDLPLIERKAKLAALFTGRKLGRVFYSEHFDKPQQFLDKACALGMEGVISKRADAPYHSGRGKAWLKTKCHRRQEFVIGGFTPPSDGGHAIGSLLLGYYDRGKLTYAGRVGTGFDHATSRAIRKKLDILVRKSMAYEAYSDAGRRGPGWKRGVTWVAPTLVCEVEFTEWTEDGALRHPSFQGMREDKDPKAIVREKAMPTSQAKRAAAKEVTAEKRTVRAPAMAAPPKPKPKTAPRGADTVTISSPTRVLWEDKGYTKQDLSDYYRTVAKWMMPHVTDRPLSLVRCPEGSGKACFFQRHKGQGLSDHVTALPLYRNEEPYLAITDSEGLQALVQMGVLEIHQWGSHAKTWDKPDMIVFDFDPAPDLPFARVREAAADMRARLKKLKLTSFVKTTGGKGLHVVVPFKPEHDWETIKEWAHAMAELMAQDAPEKYTTNIRKAARTGRIFIDYLRNGETATAISPYSTRAREGAPVSVPLDWDELPRIKSGNGLDIKSLPKRMAKLKRDPWQAFFTTKQSLPVPKRKKR